MWRSTLDNIENLHICYTLAQGPAIVNEAAITYTKGHIVHLLGKTYKLYIEMLLLN
jgi:hypothetical protein